MGGNLEDFFISHKRCKEQVNFEENGRALIGEKGEKGENYFSTILLTHSL